jgi:hypothetical protein
MPTWILELIQAIPALIQIILQSLADNPPKVGAKKEDVMKYKATIDKLKEVHQLLST